MRFARRVATAVAFCLTLHAAAHAQVTTADIVGRVTDSTGGVLPGATVTIEHLPSFAAPNANFGTAGFGSITSTGNAIPRQMQFAVKLLF